MILQLKSSKFNSKLRIILKVEQMSRNLFAFKACIQKVQGSNPVLLCSLNYSEFTVFFSETSESTCYDHIKHLHLWHIPIAACSSFRITDSKHQKHQKKI